MNGVGRRLVDGAKCLVMVGIALIAIGSVPVVTGFSVSSHHNIRVIVIGKIIVDEYGAPDNLHPTISIELLLAALPAAA